MHTAYTLHTYHEWAPYVYMPKLASKETAEWLGRTRFNRKTHHSSHCAIVWRNEWMNEWVSAGGRYADPFISTNIR